MVSSNWLLTSDGWLMAFIIISSLSIWPSHLTQSVRNFSKLPRVLTLRTGSRTAPIIVIIYWIPPSSEQWLSFSRGPPRVSAGFKAGAQLWAATQSANNKTVLDFLLNEESGPGQSCVADCWPALCWEIRNAPGLYVPYVHWTLTKSLVPHNPPQVLIIPLGLCFGTDLAWAVVIVLDAAL